MLEQCQILSLVNSGHPCFVSDFNGNASVVSFKMPWWFSKRTCTFLKVSHTGGVLSLLLELRQVMAASGNIIQQNRLCWFSQQGQKWSCLFLSPGTLALGTFSCHLKNLAPLRSLPGGFTQRKMPEGSQLFDSLQAEHQTLEWRCFAEGPGPDMSESSPDRPRQELPC